MSRRHRHGRRRRNTFEWVCDVLDAILDWIF